MFFSIIVPTYNPRKFLPKLLDSIATNKILDDIEIILSDDLSTEPFDDIVQQYPQLHIRTIYNDKHYGFPGWGKQHGLEEAQGDWVCFCDQDDIYLDNSFDIVQDVIIKHDICNCVMTNMYLQREDAPEEERMPIIQALNWTHGKFYEKAFLTKYNIHYYDYHYCEDINFSNQVVMVLEETNVPFAILDLFTYVWYKRQNSLSDSLHFNGYFFDSFPEYMEGTVEMYLKAYENNKTASSNLKLFYKSTIEEALFHYYFYLQGLSNPVYNCPEIPTSYYKQIADYFTRYKKCTNQTTDDFIKYVYTDRLDYYSNARTLAANQIAFIEEISFKDWILNVIAPLEEVQE